MKTKNNSLLLTILLTILAIAILFSVYFYLLKPEMVNRDAMQQQVVYQYDEVEKLEQQVATAKKEQEKTTDLNKLKQQIPSNRDLQGIVTTIEQVESASGVTVTNVAFNNYDEKVNNATFEAEVTKEQSTAVTEADENDATIITQPEAVETLPVSDIASDELPDALRLVTMNLSVSAYSDEEIKLFLAEIEKLPRIYKIDNTEYAIPTQSADGEGIVSAKLQLTTFYYVADTASKTEKASSKAESNNAMKEATTDLVNEGQ